MPTALARTRIRTLRVFARHKPIPRSRRLNLPPPRQGAREPSQRELDMIFSSLDTQRDGNIDRFEVGPRSAPRLPSPACQDMSLLQGRRRLVLLTYTFPSPISIIRQCRDLSAAVFACPPISPPRVLTIPGRSSCTSSTSGTPSSRIRASPIRRRVRTLPPPTGLGARETHLTERVPGNFTRSRACAQNRHAAHQTT